MGLKHNVNSIVAHLTTSPIFNHLKYSRYVNKRRYSFGATLFRMYDNKLLNYNYFSHTGLFLNKHYKIKVYETNSIVINHNRGYFIYFNSEMIHPCHYTVTLKSEIL